MEIQVVPVSTYDASHQSLALSGQEYIVWDVALDQTVLAVLGGVQYAEGADTTAARATASRHLRRVLFIYLSRKLRRYEHTAAAFGRLAAEEPPISGLPVFAEQVVGEIYDMQRMLMFFHEAAHALFRARPLLRETTVMRTEQLMAGVGGLLTPDEIAAHHPEFAEEASAEQRRRFIEELACDYQGFGLTSLAIPLAPGLPRRSWQDSIGILYGASAALATIERGLKLATSKWAAFARATGDGREIVNDAVVLPDYLTERPAFTVRRWNGLLALQAVLKALGAELHVDAYAWQDYILAKCAVVDEAVERYLIGGLNELASLEFLAKVFSRAHLHRSG
ncbi:hypothetical protein [Paractinoplanes globisporus]|nr:hypothetical protein [Actinoplanes globisporus]